MDLGVCLFSSLGVSIHREIWISLRRTEVLTYATTCSASLGVESVGWDTAGVTWSSSCTYGWHMDGFLCCVSCNDLSLFVVNIVMD